MGNYHFDTVHLKYICRLTGNPFKITYTVLAILSTITFCKKSTCIPQRTMVKLWLDRKIYPLTYLHSAAASWHLCDVAHDELRSNSFPCARFATGANATFQSLFKLHTRYIVMRKTERRGPHHRILLYAQWRQLLLFWRLITNTGSTSKRKEWSKHILNWTVKILQYRMKISCFNATQ